jgi:hypothetical protein
VFFRVSRAGRAGNKKPAAFVVTFFAAGSIWRTPLRVIPRIRLDRVVADTRPADHQTSTLQNTYFFFFAAFFFAFFLVAMIHSFRLLVEKTGIIPGTATAVTAPAGDRVSAASRRKKQPARITARRRNRFAVPCRVKREGNREEGEAEAPGNTRLPFFLVQLVRLRNRTKFRFASLRCSAARFDDASQRFAFQNTTLT